MWFTEEHFMVRVQELEESRRLAVECFLARRTSASLDGSVYTDGNTLCVGPYHVAFWHQSLIFLVPQESPNSLVKDVQATVRLGIGGHTVVEGEDNG